MDLPLLSSQLLLLCLLICRILLTLTAIQVRGQLGRLCLTDGCRDPSSCGLGLLLLRHIYLPRQGRLLSFLFTDLHRQLLMGACFLGSAVDSTSGGEPRCCWSLGHDSRPVKADFISSVLG